MSKLVVPETASGKIIFLAKLKAKEGKLDDAVALLSEVRGLTDQEPGTLTYRTSKSTDGSNTILVFEEYAGKEGHLAHGTGAGVAKLRAAFKEGNIFEGGISESSWWEEF